MQQVLNGELVDMTPEEVAALELAQQKSTDPVDYPLLPWQFSALVNYLGVDGQIRSAIAAIPDAMMSAAALARYEKSTVYRYSGPLVEQLREAIGLSSQALADAWMLAKDLRSS